MAGRSRGMRHRPGAYHDSVDVFDDLLRRVRAHGAVLTRSEFGPDSAIDLPGEAALTLCIPLRNDGWICPVGDVPHRLPTGAAAIVRGPRRAVFAGERAGARGCGEPHTGVDGAAHERDASGPTVLLVGTYQVDGEVPNRLLQVLPPVLTVPDDHDCAAMRDYLDAQLSRQRPGRQIVMDRLLDWLLVCTLRDWFDQPQATPPAWYHALADDIVGSALRAMHAAPAAQWTVASLAAEAGVSRTTFATRFTDLIGEPPLSYLTQWRMDLAADLLAEPSMTVARAARRVGYADAFGFSTAFKRARGVSPTDYRATLLADTTPAVPGDEAFNA
ncbi:hypothetical protein hbim_02681 [Mycolicibacterium mageritense]|uniref:HTH araC/xylS-type domain-containing protein n=1 Tax=Mycolicibacterium mageritense TaxID=53462 RepID=A0AAI8TUP8_MYCME|nr:hypothetical protein hbim_02681 [Mycolicibacterium mageritense]